MRKPYKIDRFDPQVIQGTVAGPCNCSQFAWQIVSLINGQITAEQEVCINCGTATGQTRTP